MHQLRILLFAVIVFMTGAANAQHSSWYVDNALVSGSNDGTSWANAWRSFAAVNWSSIQPGDTLYISGGSSSQTYNETWAVGASGTSGNPITIAIDASNPSHSGTVIFDYNGDGDSSTKTAITVNQSYITFNGNVGGTNHFQIVNLRNTLNRYTALAIDGGGSGLVFDHLTFNNDNNGITIESGTGTEIKNCTFRQIRGDRAIFLGTTGGFDANLVHDNAIQTVVNQSTPPGGSGSYGGPDGIQGGDGISVYNNTIRTVGTSVYTSTQHPDMLQMVGNSLKIYGNTFVNDDGDSTIDYDCYANANPHDIRIYNNIFRTTTESVSGYPEAFRMYCSSGGLTSITNVKILNNDFVDNPIQYRLIRFDSFRGNPTASGNEIKNNIFYNVGGNSSSNPVLWVDNSTGFTSSSFAFDANVYYQSAATQYIQFRGTSYTVAQWVAAKEPKGKSGLVPSFVSYTAFSDTNDFHLQGGDTVAKDAGVDLSAYFTIDKDGTARPQGSGWDIGAYEFASASPPAAPTGLTATVH